MDNLPIAVTMGEPAGIGGELSLLAWSQRDQLNLPAFYLRDNVERLSRLSKEIGICANITEIVTPSEALGYFPSALPVIDSDLPHPPMPGVPDIRNADAVINSIRQAVDDVRTGSAGALVTQPIHKGTLMTAGFPHPGHTEFLAELAEVKQSVMMLAAGDFRVVPITVHIPMADVPGMLTGELIMSTARTVAADLQSSFGFSNPRLAVAGLNPHAGEDGAIGREEIEVITPAVEALRSEGIDVTGPLPGDTMFHSEARQNYDVALCMYHDQALIPLKTHDFHRGVNITLGLGFPRTSPDHGTAFALAGTGRANPSSFIEALLQAERMATASIVG